VSRSNFGRAELLRLWLSYQRYALLLAALAVALPAAAATWTPQRWYVWLVVIPVAWKIAAFAWQVSSRWPRKLRATALATRRIAAGRFHPRSVRGYCGDPCFRVVANEVLRRAGISRARRRELIGAFAEKEREPAFLVVVNPDSDTPVQLRGSMIDDSPSIHRPMTTTIRNP
jgi:hypothetical protein